jgi:hypothetical protein
MDVGVVEKARGRVDGLGMVSMGQRAVGRRSSLVHRRRGF